MAKLNKNVTAKLKEIQASGRVSEADGVPLLKQNLIAVDTTDVDANGNAKATLTQEALDAIAPKAATASAPAASFQIMSGIELPESKRGFGRKASAPKYPLADFEVGQFIFIAKSPDMDNPVKTLGSTVSNFNNKYREETGQTETKTVTKRGEGNKAVLGPDGKKVKEQVVRPVYRYTRKYTIRSVEAGKQYGQFKAPADGAVIARIS